MNRRELITEVIAGCCFILLGMTMYLLAFLLQ